MSEIPSVVRHMTIAIFRKGGLRSNTKERFRQAYNIALAQCQKYGYISGMKATSKGLKHEHEGMRGFVKDTSFDAMFAWIMSDNDKKKANEIQASVRSPEERVEPSSNVLHPHGRNQKR